MAPTHPLDDLLEPGAVHMARSNPAIALEVISDLSTAISLKRLADAFGDDDHRASLKDLLWQIAGRP